MKKDKIFIQIASYRDPELLSTINHCLSRAKYPENLVFSIAWQHSIEDEWDSTPKTPNSNREQWIDTTTGTIYTAFNNGWVAGAGGS
jgi:hypothetical protein